MIPHRVLLVTLVFAAVPALPPGPAAAQEDPLPEPGTLSLDFALPEGGGGGIGISRMWSERTKLGIGVEFQYAGDSRVDPQGEVSERSTWRIALAPELRRYLRDEGPVVPFLSPRISVGYTSRENSDGTRLGASLGLGAEWFPLDGVGISGQTGVSAAYRDLDEDVGDESVETWNVGFFRSSLRIEFYF